MVNVPRQCGMSAGYGWMATTTDDGIPCVYPLSDLRQHEVAGHQCWCKPFRKDDVIVHNAMDRREDSETP
jgi:hypothetical protein